MRKYFPLLCLALLCMLCPFYSAAQTPAGSFQVIDNGSAENPSDYLIAIQNADFETYRLLDKRVRLSFDNGLIFELLSAYEMQEAGFNVNISAYRIDNSPNYTPPVLSLGPNGMIAAAYQQNQTKN